MTYANKVAETVPKETQKNPPNAKPEDWRNPWKGAAIGGTLGGLVTTALGYLYGHRGRWLAYDAIAGGGTGAAIGYGVDTHNNSKAEERRTQVSPHSMRGSEATNARNAIKGKEEWQNARNEWLQIMQEGGFDTSLGTSYAFWRNPWWKNGKRRLQLLELGADKPTYEEALPYIRHLEKRLWS
jgi:hypothetical protein